jgi:hypothetical protein
MIKQQFTRTTRKQQWAKLAKVIGAGRKIDAAETDRRWAAWKSGAYDPTTGVYGVALEASS